MGSERGENGRNTVFLDAAKRIDGAQYFGIESQTAGEGSLDTRQFWRKDFDTPSCAAACRSGR